METFDDLLPCYIAADSLHREAELTQERQLEQLEIDYLSSYTIPELGE